MNKNDVLGLFMLIVISLTLLPNSVSANEMKTENVAPYLESPIVTIKSSPITRAPSFIATVRNTFKQDYSGQFGWMSLYGHTYREMRFQNGYRYTGYSVISKSTPWWSDTTTYTFRDNYSTW